jgi:hypothetical protein
MNSLSPGRLETGAPQSGEAVPWWTAGNRA